MMARLSIGFAVLLVCTVAATVHAAEPPPSEAPSSVALAPPRGVNPEAGELDTVRAAVSEALRRLEPPVKLIEPAQVESQTALLGTPAAAARQLGADSLLTVQWIRLEGPPRLVLTRDLLDGRSARRASARVPEMDALPSVVRGLVGAVMAAAPALPAAPPNARRPGLERAMPVTLRAAVIQPLSASVDLAPQADVYADARPGGSKLFGLIGGGLSLPVSEAEAHYTAARLRLGGGLRLAKRGPTPVVFLAVEPRLVFAERTEPGLSAVLGAGVEAARWGPVRLGFEVEVAQHLLGVEPSDGRGASSGGAVEAGVVRPTEIGLGVGLSWVF